MSIILADGFELGVGINKWAFYSGTLGSPGRYGVGNYFNINSNGPYKDLGSNLATSVVSLSFRNPMWSTSNFVIDWYDTSNTSNYQLRVNVTLTSIIVKTPSTTLTTYNYAFSDLKWYWLSVKTTINNTKGVVMVNLNGSTVINLTSKNTRGTTTNNYANRIWIKNAASGTYIDDVIITDTSGSKFNDVITEKTIKAYFPNADGSANDWIPSTGSRYTCVDEPSTNNGDTDYVSSSTVGAVQLFAMSDVNNATSLDAVQITSVAKKDDSTSRVLRTVLRTNSTNYESADQNLTTSYQAYTTIYDTNPNTTSTWDQTGFNGIEAGAKVQA
jgi:hypothetical protein